MWHGVQFALLSHLPAPPPPVRGFHTSVRRGLSRAQLAGHGPVATPVVGTSRRAGHSPRPCGVRRHLVEGGGVFADGLPGVRCIRWLPPCNSYATVPKYNSPYAYCSLDKAVDAQVGGVSRSPDGLFAQKEWEPIGGRPAVRGKRTYGGRPGQRVEKQGTWASGTQKHSEAGYGRPVNRGAWTAKTVKRPRQQPAHPQYANYWAPLTGAPRSANRQQRGRSNTDTQNAGATPGGTRAGTADKEEGHSEAREATRTAGTGNQNGGDGRACAWEAATIKGMAWPASPVATGCQGNPCSTGIGSKREDCMVGWCKKGEYNA